MIYNTKPAAYVSAVKFIRACLIADFQIEEGWSIVARFLPRYTNKKQKESHKISPQHLCSSEDTCVLTGTLEGRKQKRQDTRSSYNLQLDLCNLTFLMILFIWFIR